MTVVLIVLGVAVVALFALGFGLDLGPRRRWRTRFRRGPISGRWGRRL